jgi:hypothetical protein
MIASRSVHLALDNRWRDSFSPSNTALALPATVTSGLVTMTLDRINRSYTPPSDWWNGPDVATIGTTTGEITTDNNKINVEAEIPWGTYRVRGDITISDVTTPWINGVLTIGNGMAQMYLNPLGSP